MMSAAGTPSADPWVVLQKERIRYEEQFRSLKPVNGIITGDQAKGFFLQSQLPPLILGQIWALADTDCDGKMNIDEFSIACKLINLKLRGYDVPKMLPLTLLASLKAVSTPAIPPFPRSFSISAPPRPEPPIISQLASQPNASAQPILPNLATSMPPVSTNLPQTGMVQPSLGHHISTGGLPTGIITPIPSVPLVQTGNMPPIQPIIPSMQSTTQPSHASIQPSVAAVQPAMAPISGTMSINQHLVGSVPAIPPQPLIGGSVVPGVASIPSTGDSLLSGGLRGVNMSAVSTASDTMNTMLSGLSSGPIAGSSPMSSVTSLEKSNVAESSQVDWLIPLQTKLNYTQVFNTADRTRTGYLYGPQARNIMIQSKLPQNILAQIWTLSDMDTDGRLGCEEFVLAMHLCEQAAAGNAVPLKLPLELIPPSFRKTSRSLSRTASVSSQGSVALDLDPASTLLQASFEDKRKENFEKGQAELERRRKQLLDQQRKEAEERERKEREEIERREKARQEAERKRLEELEKQMRDQQEQERIKEEERKRQADQREAARKEMERQRQLEWEKQRLQELQQQRQREQENVLKLKAKNQSLTIELSTLNEQVKDLSQKICDTRLGVSNVKSTIDGMRTTRDSQMQEMSQLKNKLKEQNAKLLALSQEKVKLDAKNKQNQMNGGDSDKIAFENKEINIKNLREKVADMQRQINGKMTDIENNNSVLNNLKSELQTLISECESLYKTYEEKRDTILEMKRSSKSVDYSSTWKDESTWNDTTQVSDWGDDNWKTTNSTTQNSQITSSDFVKYRALYEFVARNGDEISFQPGDIINVPKVQTAEPGWLAGEIRGQTGWFPESYVEPVDGVGISVTSSQPEATSFSGFADSKPLEGIAEISEPAEVPTDTISNDAISPTIASEKVIDYYVANYPYQSQEPGDLTFNAGDVVAVIKQEGEWWTGKLKDAVGIFPSNYVQKVNNAPNTAAVQDSTTLAVSGTAESCQVDSEVSQINEVNSVEIPFNASMMTNAQVVKSKKPEIASVIAPYQASSPEQLSLQRGQLIMIRKKTDSGWWEGELQAKGRKRQVGWFPASYVKILNSSGKTSGRTTPVSTTRIQQEVVIDKVIALYPYTAGNPDELSFNKDDIISVTTREEEAWWRGELNGVSGLFPSNYVTALQQQSPFQGANQRQECITELIDTEKAYVEDLAIICQVFEQPLKKSKVISNKEISQIFLNWEEIVRCNGDFLKDITRRLHEGNDVIGDLLLKHLPCFIPYISFCTNELDSAILLQNILENSTAFKYFLKKCQLNPLVKGMPLSSFLIKPMQRITKYPLLIGKILENTTEDHEDYPQLKEALQVAEEFLNCINENIRVKENLDRMDWLQKYVQNDLNLVFNSNTNKLGPRKLLHYGILSKLKSGKELIGFLFNDMFILVQPNKATNTQFTFPKNSNNNFKLYKQAILIQNLLASVNSTDTVEKNTDWNRVLNIVDESSKHSLLLLTPTVNECNLWIKNIDGAKLFYTKISELTNSRRKMKVHIGPACGRLLIVVQKGQGFMLAVNESGVILCLTVIEAKEVVPSVWKYTKTKSLRRKGKNYVSNIFCKITLGEQEERTDIAKEFNTNNSSNGNAPVFTFTWNHSMQFHLKNIYEEVLTFEVLEISPFTPDVALGRYELRITDILSETENASGPIIKKLLLRQAESGELTIKLDLQLFKNE